MNHPEPELLLRYAEGEPVEAAVARHFAECEECAKSLADLGSFEASVAAATPISPRERQAMRGTATRLLQREGRAAGKRWRLVAPLVLAAAAVLGLAVLWPVSHSGCVVMVRRYAPQGEVRGNQDERFRLDIELAAPRWLMLWRLEAGGRWQRLLPNADPLLGYLGAAMPLAAGRHRLPAAELLDFEFEKASPPTALLLVPTLAEPTAAELAAIEASLTASPTELPSAVAARHPEAKLIPFPNR